MNQSHCANGIHAFSFCQNFTVFRSKKMRALKLLLFILAAVASGDDSNGESVVVSLCYSLCMSVLAIVNV